MEINSKEYKKIKEEIENAIEKIKISKQKGRKFNDFDVLESIQKALNDNDYQELGKKYCDKAFDSDNNDESIWRFNFNGKLFGELFNNLFAIENIYLLLVRSGAGKDIASKVVDNKEFLNKYRKLESKKYSPLKIAVIMQDLVIGNERSYLEALNH